MLIRTFLVLATIFFSFRPALNAGTEAENGVSKLDSYFRYIPSGSVSAQPGKIEIVEAESEYSYEFKLFDKLPVKFSLDNKYLGIENTTAVELPAHLVGLSTDIETTLPFFNFNNTYLRSGISPSFFGDTWDFASSSFRLPFRSFLIYLPEDKWTFLAGVAVYPEFEREVFPILGFIYKPNERLTFNILPERPNISYLLNDKVTLFAEGGSSFNEFEVTKDNLKNVVLKYREAYLGAGIKYKLNKYIQASLQAGGIFSRSLKYRDSLGKVKVKDSVYTEFRLEIKI